LFARHQASAAQPSGHISFSQPPATAFSDALTNGGLGVAFFSPFDTTRYFLPWRPILVSPISLTRFWSHRGIEVLQSELLWIWIPAGALAVLVIVVRNPQRNYRGEKSSARDKR